MENREQRLHFVINNVFHVVNVLIFSLFAISSILASKWTMIIPLLGLVLTLYWGIIYNINEKRPGWSVKIREYMGEKSYKKYGISIMGAREFPDTFLTLLLFFQFITAGYENLDYLSIIWALLIVFRLVNTYLRYSRIRLEIRDGSSRRVSHLNFEDLPDKVRNKLMELIKTPDKVAKIFSNTTEVADFLFQELDRYQESSVVSKNCRYTLIFVDGIAKYGVAYTEETLA